MIQKKSTTILKRKRARLAQRISRFVPHLIRGSLFETYIPCGYSRCKCHQTGGHGPKHYLTTCYPGGRKPERDYIPQAYTKTINEHLTNLKDLRKIIEDICMINLEILRRRDKL